MRSLFRCETAWRDSPITDLGGFVFSSWQKLRRLLADACLDALEPDLIILDEFQRFKELLDTHTPSGELAQHLFEYEDSHTKVRTLLLSATPYKMYTLSHEADDNTTAIF